MKQVCFILGGGGVKLYCFRNEFPASLIINKFIQLFIFFILITFISTNLFCESQLIVNIGTWKSFPVIFENENISTELKQAIIEDINLVFAHRKKCRIYKRRKKDITIRGKKETIDTYINFSGTYNFRPEEYSKNNFHKLIELNGKQFLIIPEGLIKAYETAYQWGLENKDIVTKLDKFLNTINNKEFVNNLSEDELKKIFYVPERLKKDQLFINQVSYKDRIRRYNQYEIRRSSLLGIKKAIVDSKQVLFCSILLFAGNEVQTFALIYDLGRWQIPFTIFD